MLRTLKKRFCKSEDGSVTVEAMLWIPMFAVFFLSIADVALIFYGQSQMFRVAQDGNRLLSIGRLTDEDETEAYITARMAEIGKPVRVETSISADNVITTVVKGITGDFDAVGVFGVLTNVEMAVSSQHVKEL